MLSAPLALTAEPVGTSAAFTRIAPSGMSFEQSCRLEGQPETEQLPRFLFGKERGLRLPCWLMLATGICRCGRQRARALLPIRPDRAVGCAADITERGGYI